MATSNFASYSAKNPTTLTNCDKEPIHIIGTVQSHGCVFVVDQAFIIQYVSQNVVNFLQYTAEEIIGKHFKRYFETFPGTFDNLKQYGVEETFQFKEMVCEARRKDDGIGKYHLYCHINKDGFMIIELEHLQEDSVDYFMRLSQLFIRFAENQDMYSVLELAAEEITEVTGYDRVMVYEFDEEWNGSVIVEKTELQNRYLGLHYPATDIPAQARALFSKNRFRIIRDVDSVVSPLLPQTKDVDLSYCFLRSSSLMHLQYLRNMDCAASLTLSLLVGNDKKLWGMITCHHTSPRDISFAKRKYVDLVAKVVSLQLEALLQRKEIDDRVQLENQLSLIKQSLSLVNVDHLPSESIGRLCPNIALLLRADGVILKFKDNIYKYGRVGSAPPKIIRALMAVEKQLYFTDSVPQDLGVNCDDGMCCGILATKLTEPDQMMILVRNEFIRSVSWAGQPTKPSTGNVLHPRASFEKWREIKRGKSIAWSSRDFDYAQTIQSIISQFLYKWRVDFLQIQSTKEQAENEKLLREQEIMRQSAMMQNAFISNISHELRTPIHAIVGNSERLIELLNDAPLEVRQCVSTIQGSSEHLLAVINDILDISKLESNKVAIQLSPFELYQKLETIVSSLYPTAASKGVYLMGLFDLHLPSIVISDTIRLGQILLNYLSNALKFTTTGGITFIFEKLGHKDGKYEVVFKVKDTGIGIEDTKLEKLFQRFYQVETGRTRKFEGTGLGLAISKQLAVMMGGDVGVSSVEGEGSTFWVKLPLGIIEGTKIYPYSKLHGELPKHAQAIVFDDRDFVKVYTEHYFKQWKINTVIKKAEEFSEELLLSYGDSLYVVMLRSSMLASKDVTTIIQNIKNLRSSVRILFIEDPTSHSEPPSTLEHDGVLKMPLCMIQLFTCLSGSGSAHAIEIPKTGKSIPDASPPPNSPRMNVLVVDDNKSNQNIAQFFLHKLGHAVDVVDNGMLAVKANQENQYDVILMDVLMPVMDGLSATVQIRYDEKHSGRHVPIVALTASSDSSMLVDCKEAGMDLFLLKPFKKVELENVLNQARDLILKDKTETENPK